MLLLLLLHMELLLECRRAPLHWNNKDDALSGAAATPQLPHGPTRSPSTPLGVGTRVEYQQQQEED